MNSNLDGTIAALADGTRRAVVELLSKGPRRAGDLSAELSMSPAAMSRHLRILRRSGLISEEGIEQDARVRIYQLQQAPFNELRRWVDEVESFWNAELAAFKKHVEKRKR